MIQQTAKFINSYLPDGRETASSPCGRLVLKRGKREEKAGHAEPDGEVLLSK